MDLTNPYIEIIAVCVILILSYQFNWISKVFRVPSVLLLILLGIIIRYGLDYFGVKTTGNLMHMLEIIGIVGLIMIVLEASLDLELTREKGPLIWKSFFLAVFSLAGCILFISWLLFNFLVDDVFSAILYSIPLSVVSSAIVIPSVGSLLKKNRESLVYESTFSDILAIMVFFYVLGNIDETSARNIVINVSINLGSTLVLSVVFGYLMVITLDRLKAQVKLFLLIAVLVMLYAIGKLLHFSSLVMILIFGIILNNSKIFFAGRLKKWIHLENLKKVQNDFSILTMESTFFIRTFFFVIFGFTLELKSLIDPEAALISLVIITVIYLIRALSFKVFMVKRLFPEVFIAPRGLITILLFFSIPVSYQNTNFNADILLYVILVTSLVMAFSLMVKGKDRGYADRLNFDDWDELDREIDNLSKKN